MKTIYQFLYFLQKQSLYFSYQDRILKILESNPQDSCQLLIQKIRDLNSQMVDDVLFNQSSSQDPFPDISIKRIRYGELEYPSEFTRLIDPPLVLSYLGEPLWLKDKISVVGSRLPSQKSLWWLSKELKSILSKGDVISVSGGAMGVDQIVHQTSVDLKRPTIVILPSGLKELYPRTLAIQSKSILQVGGCLLSEFPDYQVVKKYHFSYRNRLIAALGKFSIIVEAREKSGSLITAHRALEMGKDVFVVPGHPLDESFRGSLSLLKMGAHIITQSEDIEYWY